MLHSASPVTSHDTARSFTNAIRLFILLLSPDAGGSIYIHELRLARSSHLHEVHDTSRKDTNGRRSEWQASSYGIV